MSIVPPDAFELCGPTYLAASPVIDASRSINLYPEPGIKTSNTQMGLIGRPGMTLFATPGGTVSHSLWAGQGRLFGALGGHVYELSNAGTVLTDFGAGLTVGQASPAPFVSNNQQLLICDALAGKIFYIDPGGPAMTQVFAGKALEYLDGFHVAIATGASLIGSNPNQINVSNFLDAGTAASWGVLNYALRTSSADLTVQLAVLNRLLWVFGEKSLTAFYNAGTAGFPFAEYQGASIGIGCLAAGSVAKFYNTVMWLGADDRGYAQVYMLQGMNPVRVSNPAIEFLIANYGPTNLQYAKAFAYQEAGHTFYVLNLCNSSYQITQTLVYDLTAGLWHERTYNALGPYPTAFASVANFGAAFANFIADDVNGKVYYQSITLANDAGAAITYQRTAPHVNNQGKVLKHNCLEIYGDIGTANPVLTYSNDGGRTFGATPSYSMLQNTDTGFSQTTFKRVWARQLGRSRDRVYKVTITDDTNLIRLAGAYLDVS